MKTAKKSISILLLCIIISVASPLQTLAVGRVQPEKTASLSIDYHFGGVAVSGADFNIYYIASVDEYVNFTLTDEFSKYPIQADNNTVDGWNKLSETLRGYVLADGLTPLYSATTDNSGKFTLKGLNAGLYLIIGAKRTIGDYTYTAQPSIVSLPSADAKYSTWDYDVTIYPKASAKYNYSDNKEVSRKVLKVWEDSDKKENRPNEIIVQLLCDDRIYDTVTLNADNNWRYTWEKLPQYDQNNTKIEWSIVEETKLDDYTVKIEVNGITFVVTNTYSKSTPPGSDDPEEPVDIDDDPVPKGDNDDPTPLGPDDPEEPVDIEDDPAPKGDKLPQSGVLWWPVPVMAATGLLLFTIGFAGRKRKHDEK